MNETFFKTKCSTSFYIAACDKSTWSSENNPFSTFSLTLPKLSPLQGRKQSRAHSFYYLYSNIKLLDFATYNNLVLANTLGNHEPSRRWTWHSPDGTHHNQTDYILVKKLFRSRIKTARTRTFPGVDVGSDHDMVMMTFQTRLKDSKKPT